MPEPPQVTLDLDTITPEDLYDELLGALCKRHDVVLTGCGQLVAIVSPAHPATT